MLGTTLVAFLLWTPTWSNERSRINETSALVLAEVARVRPIHHVGESVRRENGAGFHHSQWGSYEEAGSVQLSYVKRKSEPMSQEVRAELAPTGTLRAALNLGNSLLVTGRNPSTGIPKGVAPDLARAIAERIGVPVTYVPFDRPSMLADAADTGVWDIGLIGADPDRAEKIDFTAAYAEIEATYLVPSGSSLTYITEVDQPGIRISASARSAYDLWLQRNVKHAKLMPAANIDASFEQFVMENMEALAGLRPRLMVDAEKLPGSRLLDGCFMRVQQAVGTSRANRAGAAFLRDFIEEAKVSGLVASLIAHHKISGLSVASAA